MKKSINLTGGRDVRLILIILLFSFCGVCNAEVTAKILKYEIDSNNGTIKVLTNYKIDGKDVISQYGKCCADESNLTGYDYFVSRYTAVSFAGLSNEEIISMIEGDVKRYGETLIQTTFIEKENQKIVDSALAPLVGKILSVSEATIKVDTDKDGNVDKEWAVSTDGSKVESEIVP